MNLKMQDKSIQRRDCCGQKREITGNLYQGDCKGDCKSDCKINWPFLRLNGGYNEV